MKPKGPQGCGCSKNRESDSSAREEQIEKRADHVLKPNVLTLSRAVLHVAGARQENDTPTTAANGTASAAALSWASAWWCSLLLTTVVALDSPGVDVTLRFLEVPLLIGRSPDLALATTAASERLVHAVVR